MVLALVLHIQSEKIIDAGARLSLRRATTHLRGSCGLVGRLTSTKCSVSFRLRPSQPVLFAARLEALAQPGGIFVSGTVHYHVADKMDLEFEDLGRQQLKHQPSGPRLPYGRR